MQFFLISQKWKAFIFVLIVSGLYFAADTNRQGYKITLRVPINVLFLIILCLFYFEISIDISSYLDHYSPSSIEKIRVRISLSVEQLMLIDKTYLGVDYQTGTIEIREH